MLSRPAFTSKFRPGQRWRTRGGARYLVEHAEPLRLRRIVLGLVLPWRSNVSPDALAVCYDGLSLADHPLYPHI